MLLFIQSQIISLYLDEEIIRMLHNSANKYLDNIYMPKQATQKNAKSSKSGPKSKKPESKTQRVRCIWTKKIRHSPVESVSFKDVGKKSALDEIAENIGLEAKFELNRGAKRPTTARSVTSVADATSCHARNPSTHYWGDILRKNNPNAELPENIKICAITGLVGDLKIDKFQLDHTVPARIWSLVEIPMTTEQCESGHFKDVNITEYTLASANMSVGADSYFTKFKRFCPGYYGLSVLVSDKASIKTIKDQKYIINPLLKMISDADIRQGIRSAIKAVENSTFKKSKTLVDSIKNVNSKLENHIETHLQNIKNWDSIKNLLYILNKEIWQKLMLFVPDKYDGKQLPEPDFYSGKCDPIPVGVPTPVSLLADTANRIINLKGTRLLKILEMAYNISNYRDLKTDTFVSKYDVVKHIPGKAYVKLEPKVAKAPELEPFNKNNPAHVIASWNYINDYIKKADGKIDYVKFVSSIKPNILNSSNIKTEGRSVRELKNIMIDQFELMTDTDAKEVVDVLSELNNPRVMEEINREVDEMNRQLESKTCGDQNSDDTYLCLSQSEPNSPLSYSNKLINMNRGNESDGYESDIYVESARKPGSKEHIDFSTEALENIRRIVSRNKTSKKKASPKNKSPKSSRSNSPKSNSPKSSRSNSPKSNSPKSSRSNSPKSSRSNSPKSNSPKSNSPKSNSPKSNSK